MIRIIPAAILIASLSACGDRSSEADRHIVEGSTSIIDSKGEFDAESARADAIAEISDSSFEDTGDTSLCTDDCSGHEAGFEWARDNTPEDPNGCVEGYSESFAEGCEGFHKAVDNKVAEMREQWEHGS